MLLTEIDTVNLLSLSLIFLIGLPHGSFDLAIVMGIVNHKTLPKITCFIFSYIGLGVIVILTWIVVPQFALIVFLIISVIHFGLGDTLHSSTNSISKLTKIVQILSHGGAIISITSLSNYEEVNIIFSILAFGSTWSVWIVIKILLIVTALSMLTYFIMSIQMPELRRKFMELTALSVVFYIFPPLVSFSLYFCFIHTFRHVRSVWTFLLNESSYKYVFSTVLLLTVSSWIFGALAFLVVNNYYPPESAILQVTFIGLASLTVPHMILVDGFFRTRA
jgi:Brp/Blh family beta-carotene 15,15'-monooxygenase